VGPELQSGQQHCCRDEIFSTDSTKGPGSSLLAAAIKEVVAANPISSLAHC